MKAIDKDLGGGGKLIIIECDVPKDFIQACLSAGLKVVILNLDPKEELFDLVLNNKDHKTLTIVDYTYPVWDYFFLNEYIPNTVRLLTVFAKQDKTNPTWDAAEALNERLESYGDIGVDSDVWKELLCFEH